MKDENFYTGRARGKVNYTSGTVRVLLCVVTEAHVKMKPDLTKLVYNSNSFPKASPFFNQSIPAVPCLRPEMNKRYTTQYFLHCFILYFNLVY